MICRLVWENTQAEDVPWTKPNSTSELLYSDCHPSAALRVPHICRRSSVQLPGGASISGGSPTHMEFASSTLALKYALEMPMK